MHLGPIKTLSSTWHLFSSSINNMGFVLFWHQQHGICFHLASTTWLSKLTTAGMARRGCVNLHTPRSYQSSLNKSTEKMTKRQDKATIGLGSYKNYKVYYRSQGQEPGPSLHDRRCVGETAHCPGGDCPSLFSFHFFVFLSIVAHR